MLGTFGWTTPQAYTVDETRNCLHAPVRLVKLCGLRPVSQPKPKQLASFRDIRLTCRVSAISSLSGTQTDSLSNRRDMVTEGGVEVAIPELQQLCRNALSTLGYTDQQGRTITEVKCCVAPKGGSVFLTVCKKYFAGAVVCSVAQQQQQHGQGDHRGPRQAHRRGSSGDTTAEQYFCHH